MARPMAVNMSRLAKSVEPLTSLSHSRRLSSKTTPTQSIHVTTIPTTQLDNSSHSSSTPETETKTTMRRPPPLSILSASLLLRGIFINTWTSSPLLLTPSIKLMSVMGDSKSLLLNPDRNVLLRWFLKKTFYKQFCAGENPAEVKEVTKSLRDMGYKGVMLCYAKEVVLDEKAARELEESGGKGSEAIIQNEILPWKKGTLDTVAMAEPGDFVALKFTGAGSQALYNLTHFLPPSPALDAAITEICTLAHSRSIRLVFDAEQASLQPGIDAWTLSYMSRYNTPSAATVYCTYQCYLKAAPRVLSTHLAAARRGGFALGVKLVRGAYINSDPRHLIHDTKADTDIHYDALAEAVLHRAYNDILQPAEGSGDHEFPAVNLALACHNIDSVRKAQAIRKEQTSKGEEKIELVYAQLQGMADEVSCELVQEANFAKEMLAREADGEGVVGVEKVGVEIMKARPDVPQAYKYLVWGTTGECMKYLLRRAQENKDAVKRTREGRDLMVGEVGRRVKGLFGFKT